MDTENTRSRTTKQIANRHLKHLYWLKNEAIKHTVRVILPGVKSSELGGPLLVLPLRSISEPRLLDSPPMEDNMFRATSALPKMSLETELMSGGGSSLDERENIEEELRLISGSRRRLSPEEICSSEFLLWLRCLPPYSPGSGSGSFSLLMPSF